LPIGLACQSIVAPCHRASGADICRTPARPLYLGHETPSPSALQLRPPRFRPPWFRHGIRQEFARPRQRPAAVNPPPWRSAPRRRRTCRAGGAGQQPPPRRHHVAREATIRPACFRPACCRPACCR